MKTRARHRESGTLLIAVLIVCLGLVSITLLFAHASMMDYRGAENDLAGRQGEQAVEAGARYAKYLIGAVETKGTIPDSTTYTPDELPVGPGYFWFIGRPADSTVPITEPVFGLVDESAKLNLNDKKNVTKEILLKLPGMTEEVAAAIVAWRDPEGGTTTSNSYSQRQPAYRCKAAPFDSVEELALVEGVDLALLGGQDMNRNGVLDNEESDSSRAPMSTLSGAAVDGPGLWEYVTVFSKEPNPAVAEDGTARPLATTTSPPPVELLALLTAKVPQSAPAVAAALGALGGRTIGSALEFYILTGMSAEDFDLIADYLRFSEDATLYPINVNTASAAVLACIPGLEDKADAIISARASRAPGSTSITWLKEVLTDPEIAVRAGPFLTGKTFTITADVAAVGRFGRGYRRSQFVFDTSETTPKIIYRRNLGWLGWALGREVRAFLDQEKEAVR
jgi:type II secretory pathway component PulK